MTNALRSKDISKHGINTINHFISNIKRHYTYKSHPDSGLEAMAKYRCLL